MTLRLGFLPLSLLLASCHAHGEATTYYVDFAAGRDSANGTSPATPWQHAPGDEAATGAPAGVTLGAGDIVRFKGGVAYRGSIRAQTDGDTGKPITYTGSGYGSDAAIIEGADPVTAITPCPSAQACGGAPTWRKLSLVTFTPPATRFIKFFDSEGILQESQWPVPADPFYSDETASFAVSPLADKTKIESGGIDSPELAKLLGGAPSGTLQIWVFGNMVVRRPVTGVDGDTLRFDPAGIRLYPDRPGRYALTGSAAAIGAPGQYATAGPGRAIVWTRPGGTLMIGNGRGGFDLNGRSHIAITGFVFQHQTAAIGARTEGAPIVRAGRAGTNLVISGNRFENSSLWDGKGVITLSNIADAIISNNRISRIERGSGLRVGANTSRIKVTGNRIDHVGRTGIAFLGAADSEISDNIITDLRGVHGNGMSLYLNNRRIKVTNNRVLETVRPMTFHGDKRTIAPGDNDFIIERNIFIATSTAQAALTSWGAKTRGVTIRNNVLIASRGGLLTDGSDTGVTIADNYLSGIIFHRGQGAGWTVVDNRTADAALRVRAEDTRDKAGLCKGAGVPAETMLGGIRC
jgi:hypothetical protein